MTVFVFILALYLDPVGSITEEPWDFITPVEEIDVIPVEELEKKLLRQRYRILEASPETAP